MAATFDEDRKARARALVPGGTANAAAPEMFNQTAPGTMVAPKPAAKQLAETANPGTGYSANGFMPGSQAVYRESGKAISDLAGQGRYGAAAGETARAALAYVPAVADDVLGKPVAALAGGVWDGTKQFLGLNDGVQPKTAPSVTPSANPAGPRAANVAQTKNPAANQGVAPVTAGPTTPAQQPAKTPTQTPSAPTNNGYTDLGNGIYRKGNEFTDQAGTGDTKFAARGAPTPQAMAALDNLTKSRPGVYSGTTDAFQQLANLQKLNAQPVQSTAVQPSNPQASGFNRDESIRALTDITSPEYRALRSLKMDAESEAADRARMGRGYKGAGAGDAYNALIKEITTGTREGQTAEMKDATDRYGIDRREDGATQRTAMGEQGANARAMLTAGLQGEELGLKREAQGYQTRAAARLEDLQNKYMAAKTPEEQQSILAKYNALAGNAKNTDVWNYAPGKPMVDANGNIVDTSGVLFNKQTGETREVAKGGGQQAQGKPQYKQGQVYTDANGARAIWDGEKFVAAE